MDVYLIRHAEAVALGEQGIAEDADRPLTEKGEKQARDVAKGLQAKGIRIDTLLTSPLVRAKQTAEILVKNWDGKAPEIVFCDELIPDVRPKKLAKRLRQIAAERVGLIGHNPQLRYFGSWLIGSKRAQLNLTKAGVAYIQVEDLPARGMGTLEWLVPPKWFEES